MEKETFVEILKEHGLEVAEDTAVAFAKSVIKAMPAVLTATENKVDDLLIPLFGLIEPQIMQLLDGIDGKDDPEL